jgi:PAS domain-containing protein
LTQSKLNLIFRLGIAGTSPINAQSGATLPTAPSASQHVSVSTVGFSSPSSQPLLATIAPQPSKPRSLNISTTNELSDDDHAAEDDYFQGDKRLMKRVANRRSAQLSRKRKKQFIEELKEENDGLRRKELILKSIPDLVVVFDSTGKLWFVSESVSRFMDFNADDLVGTSFWSRLCEDSVRLLKAAFMDSLAARQTDSETAALGEGIWELRLVDKDGSHKVITLNGVVHFAGDRPECVCSIRPRDDGAKVPLPVTRGNDKTRHETVSTSSAASMSSTSLHCKSSSYLQPHQSVLADAAMKHEPHRTDTFPLSRRGIVRISDCGNSSGSSESSGSGDDERNGETVQ